ncbi:hypothetical protein ANN_00051, partial [Periplaneta americana]
MDIDQISSIFIHLLILSMAVTMLISWPCKLIFKVRYEILGFTVTVIRDRLLGNPPYLELDIFNVSELLIGSIMRGKGVGFHTECPKTNSWICNIKGLSSSEYINTVKMSCNLSAVRSVPGTAFNTTRCRHPGCDETETLGHAERVSYCGTTIITRMEKPHAMPGQMMRLKTLEEQLAQLLPLLEKLGTQSVCGSEDAKLKENEGLKNEIEVLKNKLKMKEEELKNKEEELKKMKEVNEAEELRSELPAKEEELKKTAEQLQAERQQTA